MSIRNPVEWGVDSVKHAVTGIEHANRGLLQSEEDARLAIPVVRQITIADLKDVLARGFEDFGAERTDVIFLCVIYPVIGLVLANLAAGHQLLPILFPLASGFALVGPFAGVGLNEMSRRRELGVSKGWTDVFQVLSAPSLGAILLLGLVLTGVFFFWLLSAEAIYQVTLGPRAPVSVANFVNDVLWTTAGHKMIVLGIGVGFVFAAVVLVISVVAFPLLLDREVGVETAVRTSIRAAMANPIPMAVWGMIIAGSLVLGSIPFLVGLVIVLPVLGHSTWHLYRKMVVPR